MVPIPQQVGLERRSRVWAGAARQGDTHLCLRLSLLSRATRQPRGLSVLPVISDTLENRPLSKGLPSRAGLHCRSTQASLPVPLQPCRRRHGCWARKRGVPSGDPQGPLPRAQSVQVQLNRSHRRATADLEVLTVPFRGAEGSFLSSPHGGLWSSPVTPRPLPRSHQAPSPGPAPT